MTCAEELTKAIDDLNRIIDIARDLLVVGFDPNDTETILKEQERIKGFEAERDQYISELNALNT